MNAMNELAATFSAQRNHLRAVAYRILSSTSEADDAVQEAWLHLNRTDVREIQNLNGWLTTVVARVCLDMLRARKARGEAPPTATFERRPQNDEAQSPERDTLLADSIGPALLIVLDSLTPSERLAFVLHDMFDVPFEEIGAIVGCSPVAARQLASRARRRVQGGSIERTSHDLSQQREVVEAFLIAARGGDLNRLLSLLDPNVVFRADEFSVARHAAHPNKGAPNLLPEARGTQAVAGVFAGKAQAARLALIDGLVGAAWAPDGVPRVFFDFRLTDGRITSIEVIADPTSLTARDVALLDE